MSKIIKLQTEERLHLAGVLNQFKGGKEAVKIIMKDREQVLLSNKEKEEIGYMEQLGKNKITGENEITRMKWNKTFYKNIKLSQFTKQFVLNFIKEKSDAGLLSVADAPLLSVEEKLTMETLECEVCHGTGLVGPAVCSACAGSGQVGAETEEAEVEATEGTTEAPVEAPTVGTTEAPVEAPTVGTTEAPVEAPTVGTTLAPVVDAPVADAETPVVDAGTSEEVL